MNRIEVSLLNPEAIQHAEQMMVCAARLTQRGHKVKNLTDFMALYNKGHKATTLETMAALPHPTIQKFAVINAVVVGASRRFLAQITRHQNEVKFMSASLQYSDYSHDSGFVVPYKALEAGPDVVSALLRSCAASMDAYAQAVELGLDNDSAGYTAPQGLRNVLIISATPYQWKHMIGQRICRRNTDETRYVMLRLWELLLAESSALFGAAGPSCMQAKCAEGGMTCGRPLRKTSSPGDIVREDFPLLAGGII